MNSDLISRSELKKEFAKFDRIYIADTGNELVNAFAVDKLIDNAPTVKTYCYFCGQTEHGKIEERKTGEWIYTPNIIGLSEYEGITCSICGDDSIGDFNFCPNCGAKMKGGEEE